MSEMIIDLTNYKDRVGSRVAEGRYRVIVEDAEPDKAKSGNPMINLWFRVQGGEYDGATIVDRLVLTEKSLFRVVGFMQALGLPTPKKRFKVNIRQFVGKVLDIDVEDGDPYNGRVKSEVRGYIRIQKAAKADESAADDAEDLLDLAGVADPEPEPEALTADSEPEATETPATSEPEEVDLDTLDLG